MINIIWFRTDLRLNFNPLLQTAFNSGEKFVPLFLIDLEAIKSSQYFNAQRLSFLVENLEDLNRNLTKIDSKLIIIESSPIEFFNELTKKQKVNLYLSKHYTSQAYLRDEKIRKIVLQSGGSFNQIKTDVIFDNEDGILTKSKDPVKVFTHFKNYWLQKLNDNKEVLEFNYDVRSVFAKSLKFEISNFKEINIDSIKEFIFKNEFKGGETEAHKIWENFFSQKISNYKEDRNILSIDGTSKLSPHLKWGTISPHEIIKDCLSTLNTNYLDNHKEIKENQKGFETFLNEIIWREFYKYILAIFPNIENENFNVKFNNINWKNNEEMFEKWCKGETGYPIVDACMRQLNQTGWMHNRGRMITASFLCKDLHIDWRKGQEYFRKKLIDHDLASNNGGWQWTAGTGTDASPYFRIFNPLEQSRKFDPEGTFIKKYLPELKQVPKKFIHEPSKLSELEQAEYNCILGKDYPLPIVDHTKARQETLELYKV